MQVGAGERGGAGRGLPGGDVMAQALRNAIQEIGKRIETIRENDYQPGTMAIGVMIKVNQLASDVADALTDINGALLIIADELESGGK